MIEQLETISVSVFKLENEILKIQSIIITESEKSKKGNKMADDYDQYQMLELVARMRNPEMGVSVKDRMHQLKNYPSCFVGMF
jgi:hypothetical protein